MKLICLILTILLLPASMCAQNASATVNAIIGDESFVQTFGTQPDHATNEVLRIQTHLLYVEQQLRNTKTPGLTRKQKIKREKVLDRLHTYWTNGVFPSNYDYPGERKPCFIDRDGKICAVGYLIEKTAGREAAQKINSVHQYDYINDMNENAVVVWAKENGLTLEECAMIQPTYGNLPAAQTTEAPIQTSYGISSGFVGGANIAVNIFNLRNQNMGYSKTISTLGLLSGTAQVILGLANIRKDKITYGINGYNTKTTYKPQNNLSYINIASGAATLLTSSFNLWLKNAKKESRNNISLYSGSMSNQEMSLGLSLVRRL